MMFRFIHTGDIHLDSPLRGLAGQQGAAADRIRTATRAAFTNLVDYAVEEAANFFVIAGLRLRPIDSRIPERSSSPSIPLIEKPRPLMATC